MYLIISSCQVEHYYLGAVFGRSFVTVFVIKTKRRKNTKFRNFKNKGKNGEHPCLLKKTIMK